MPFVKSELTKRLSGSCCKTEILQQHRFFQIDKTSVLTKRLKADPNLRLLHGFKKVPGRSTFSRTFCSLARQTILREAFEKLVKRAFADRSYVT
jgi:hypothetical protein